MEPKSMLFNLSNVLTYTRKGNFEETAQVEVDAPSFSTFKESSALSQAFVQGMMASQKMLGNQAQANSSDTEAELDAATIRLMLMASDVEFDSVVNTFIDLCTKCCTLDEERKVKMIRDHFKKMSYEDIVNFTCTYIATFIAPSMLSGLQNMEGGK